MSSALIQAVYAHARWANRRILNAGARLSEEQRRVPLGPGYGSVHDTLVHVAWSHWNWVARAQGDSPREIWTAAQFPTYEAIRTRWEALEAETAVFIETLTDADLDLLITYVTRTDVTRTQPRWEMLLHQAMHAHQHRSELALYLTAAGFSPGELDLLQRPITLRPSVPERSA